MKWTITLDINKNIFSFYIVFVKFIILFNLHFAFLHLWYLRELRIINFDLNKIVTE